MFSTMTITSDPSLWWLAAFLIGGMFAIVLATFLLMYAFVQPDRH